MKTLFFPGALKNHSSITKLDKTLTDFLLEPQLVKCLLLAPRFFFLSVIFLIVIMLYLSSVLNRIVGMRRGL